MVDRAMIRSLELLHNAHHEGYEGYAGHVVAAHDPAWPTAAYRVVKTMEIMSRSCFFIHMNVKEINFDASIYFYLINS
jgi:hypothetical protein